MVASVQNAADVVNLALVRIGWKQTIGSLYDGSTAAKAALNLYGQTRDALLREADWGFPQRGATLALLKTAPPGGYVATPWSSQYPPIPWIYEYAYPADALMIRAVRRAPSFVPNFMPKPHPFDTANDGSLDPPARVVLCNVAGAIAVYCGQVTDMTQWQPDFVEAFAEALGRRLAAVLGRVDQGGAEAAKIAATAEQADTAIAVSRQG